MDIVNECFNVNFYYLGERPYIQGVVIVDRFLSVLKTAIQPINSSNEMIMINQVKFTKKVLCDGYIRVDSLDTEGASDVEECAAAEMICTYGSERFLLRFYENPALKITDRRKDEGNSVVKSIDAKGKFEGQATLHNVNNVKDLLTGFIKTNKKLHSLTLNVSEGLYNIRWAYMKGFYALPDSSFPDEISLSIKHLGSNVDNDVLYTLNNFHYTINNKDYKVQLCFYYSGKE